MSEQYELVEYKIGSINGVHGQFLVQEQYIGPLTFTLISEEGFEFSLIVPSVTDFTFEAIDFEWVVINGAITNSGKTVKMELKMDHEKRELLKGILQNIKSHPGYN